MSEPTGATCTICNIDVKTKFDMIVHLNGAEHYYRKCQLEMEVDDANESNEDAAQFCELCNMSLENIKQLQAHILGKTHFTQLKRVGKKERIDNHCALYIKGFALNSKRDELLDYFLTFGEICWVHFGNSYLLLDYTKSESAEELMRVDRQLNGKKLFIQHRIFNDADPEKQKEEDHNLQAVLELIKKFNTFEKQAQAMVASMQTEYAKAVVNYHTIVQDIYVLLRPHFVRHVVFPFGSTVTGLNFNSSDLDVYISDVRYTDDDAHYLFKIKRLLCDSQLFRSCFVIANTKIPILKCVHAATNISCDINVRNMLGVCNSKLVKEFATVDPKVRLLMMFLKYWAKVHDITGRQFSNYLLIMLVIFYLQQAPYRLPSILNLQRNCPMESTNGWNTGFQPFSNYHYPVIRSTPFLNLLLGFFNFYADFQYGLFVICPFLGVCLKRSDLLHVPNIPNYFDLYKFAVLVKREEPLKLDSSVCVQDPFEHSRNIACNISTLLLEQLTSCCNLGRILCKETQEKELLGLLLTKMPEISKINKFVTNTNSQFIIQMKNTVNYLKDKLPENSTKELIDERWFEFIVNYTKTIFKDILKFDMTEINDNNDDNKTANKYRKKIVFDCVGKFFAVRIKPPENDANKNVVIKFTGKILQNEITYSDELMSKMNDIGSSSFLNVHLVLKHVTNPNSVMVFRLENKLGCKKLFTELSIFLEQKMPLWLELHETELNIAAMAAK